jgi:hypothetical protein
VEDRTVSQAEVTSKEVDQGVVFSNLGGTVVASDVDVRGRAEIMGVVISLEQDVSAGELWM